jgi:hypothetical protein
MMLHRSGARRELVGDFHVTQTLGEQREDLELTIGESLRVRARLWARSTREATRATLIKPSASDLHSWGCSKALKDSQRRALGRFIALQEGKGLFPGQPIRSHACAAARQSPAISEA